MIDVYRLASEVVQTAIPQRPQSVSVKEHNGEYRWVALASGAYGPDRDGHWVTEKALRSWAEKYPDAVRANGESVVSRWWHVGKPDAVTNSRGPGLDLGTADLAVFHSHSLILSGTFTSKEVGRGFAETKTPLGLSIMFFHPWDEPKKNLFHTIDIFEVSFLPSHRASYPLTALAITEGVK